MKDSSCKTIIVRLKLSINKKALQQNVTTSPAIEGADTGRPPTPKLKLRVNMSSTTKADKQDQPTSREQSEIPESRKRKLTSADAGDRDRETTTTLDRSQKKQKRARNGVACDACRKGKIRCLHTKEYQSQDATTDASALDRGMKNDTTSRNATIEIPEMDSQVRVKVDLEDTAIAQHQSEAQALAIMMQLAEYGASESGDDS